ncbi:MAG: hypothetical protein EOP48_01105 [Sphingobacteriales bacterium]|nr:MAG: hypothetical protein EOP48_01105 [Sphingobacteriales bacterium]
MKSMDQREGSKELVRLGIIFMKIYRPAIAHAATSVDPAEATNAAAREELYKLNLAFEMGDNVMIYLDDKQHPRFAEVNIAMRWAAQDRGHLESSQPHLPFQGQER